MIGASPDRVPAGEVERVLEELLGSAAAPREKNWLLEILGDIYDWLGDLFSFEDAVVFAATSEVFRYALLAVGATALLLVLVAIARRLERGGIGTRLPSGDGEVTLRVEELRRRAREAEAEGDWTRALRLYFFATVVGLGDRGDLEYRHAWTNRELFERGHPEPGAREHLAPLVGELDEHSFGRRPTGAAEVRRFAAVCDRLLGREP